MKHGRYRKALDAFIAIQTTPLLASRDFMYAHAQLDFESRLMKSSASERGDLSDRVGRRKNNVQVAAREHPSEEEDYAVSASSGLPADCDHQPNGTERPTTEELYQAHSQEGHEGSSSATAIEMTSLESHGNGKSGVEQPGKGNNPYFYHIGATGYFRRLWELWRNKRCRRALLSASVAMISQQMTGE
jgi:hypothetical protein